MNLAMVSLAMAAGQPSALTSTQPAGLVIRIGSNVNSGAFPVTYTIRDDTNQLLPGVNVVLDFGGCVDVHLCSSNVGPGLTVNCSGSIRTVTGVTDAFGKVAFIIAGSSHGLRVAECLEMPAQGPGSFAKCVTVTADNIPMSNLNAATADYDGFMGVDGSDLGMFACDLFSGLHPRRSDFDGNNVVDGIDLGFFAEFLFGPAGVQGCTTYCP